METKSRYEVMAELEAKKRDYILERDSSTLQIAQKEKQIKNVNRQLEDLQEDLDLFKFIIPYVYQHTASAIRPQISVRHAWFAEHKNTLGSCPEYLLLDALTPKVKDKITKPTSAKDYNIPSLKDVPDDIKNRFQKIEDLVDKLSK